jgi:hypothetical protein
MNRATQHLVAAAVLGAFSIAVLVIVVGFVWAVGLFGQIRHAGPSTAPIATAPMWAPSSVPSSPAKRKMWTRVELRDWFTTTPDKTPAMVKAELGLPESTLEENGGRFGADYTIFVYPDLTRDAEGSGKVDPVTWIYFNRSNDQFQKLEFPPSFRIR